MEMVQNDFNKNSLGVSNSEFAFSTNDLELIFFQCSKSIFFCMQHFMDFFWVSGGCCESAVYNCDGSCCGVAVFNGGIF